MNFKHQSVLLDETIENLNIQPEGFMSTVRWAAEDMPFMYAAG